MSLWVRLVLISPVVHCWEQAAYSGDYFPPHGAWWPKQLGTQLNFLFFAGPQYGGSYSDRDLKLLWESGYKGVYANDDTLQTLMDEIGFEFGYKPSTADTYSTEHMTSMETFYVTTMSSETPVLLWNGDSWDTAAKTLQLYRLKKGYVEAYSWEQTFTSAIRELCYLGYTIDPSSSSDTTWVAALVRESGSDQSITVSYANTTCMNYTDINAGAVAAMDTAPFMKYLGFLTDSIAIFGGGQTGKLQEEWLLKANVRVILNLQGAEKLPLLNKKISDRAIIDANRSVNWTSCASGGVDDSCPGTDPSVNYESNNDDKYGDGDGLFSITTMQSEKNESMNVYHYACCSDWDLAETQTTALAAFRKALELGSHLYSNCAVGYRGVSIPLAFWGLLTNQTEERMTILYNSSGMHEMGETHAHALFTEAECKSWCGSFETGDICETDCSTTDAAVLVKLSFSLALLVTFLTQAI